MIGFIICVLVLMIITKYVIEMYNCYKQISNINEKNGICIAVFVGVLFPILLYINLMLLKE